MAEISPPNYAAIARLYWMIVGPMILFVSTVLIVLNGNGWWTLADWVYLVTLAGLAPARWIEFRGGQPMRSTGEPATQVDLRNYSAGVLAIGLAGWVAANLFGNAPI